MPALTLSELRYLAMGIVVVLQLITAALALLATVEDDRP